jgi:PKD repeat protein
MMRKSYSTIALMFLFGMLGFNSNAQSCLPNWQYRMPITITNPNAVALVNHQVKLTVNTQALISAAKMNLDASDLRMATGCCSQLCYWIEAGVNTTATDVWVNVDSIPASGSAVVYMYYGNTAAADSSNGACTFDLFEDFDGAAQTSFSNICGTTTESFASGNLNVSWGSSGMLGSNATFPMSDAYTVESDVVGTTGTWPGLYWAKDVTKKSYGLMVDVTQARVSLSGGGTDYCSGHNWASSLVTYSGTAGLWSFTWISTGNFVADFPTIGNIPCTDILYNKDEDLRLCVGGISSGSGSIDMNWVRVRKYAAMDPTSVSGVEETPPGMMVVSISAPNTGFCSGDSLQLDAGAGFVSYTWSNGPTVQSSTASSVGTYTITATDSAGCVSMDSIAITEFIPVPVSIGTDITACSDSVIILDAGTVHNSYAWSTGGTANTETVTAEGIIDIVAIDSNGCMAYDTMMVTYYPVPVADFTSVTQGHDADFTNTSTNGDTYLWTFGDGNTSTLENPSHTYAADSTYTVCLAITSADGCIDDTCFGVSVSTASVDMLHPLSMSIYPVPADEQLTVELVIDEDQAFELLTITGELVLTGELTNGTNVVNVKALASGTYLLRLKNFENYSRRIVID